MTAVAEEIGSSVFWSRRGRAADLSDGPGPFPIRVTDDPETGKVAKLELIKPSGTETFRTTRALIRAIHGPRSYANWPLDQYVARGRYEETPTKGRFDTTPGLSLVTTEPANWLPPELTEPVFDPSLGIAPVVFLPTPVGIDLAKRGHEVAKLLSAGFGMKIREYGYEFDDVLQEVHRKLLVSNVGRSPWDPSKSSFGHFVHLVCRSALWNYHRSHLRRLPYEQIGLKGYRTNGLWGDVDASESHRARTRALQAHHPDEALQDLSLHLLREARDPKDTDAACLAVDILPLVRQGYGRGEIARRLEIKPPVVSRALAYLRQHACTWKHR